MTLSTDRFIPTGRRVDQDLANRKSFLLSLQDPLPIIDGALLLSVTVVIFAPRRRTRKFSMSSICYFARSNRSAVTSPLRPVLLVSRTERSWRNVISAVSLPLVRKENFSRLSAIHYYYYYCTSFVVVFSKDVVLLLLFQRDMLSNGERKEGRPPRLSQVFFFFLEKRMNSFPAPSQDNDLFKSAEEVLGARPPPPLSPPRFFFRSLSLFSFLFFSDI